MITPYENAHMTSEDFLGEEKTFSDCSWLAGSVVNGYTAKEVYNKTTDVKNLVFEEITTRPIPLSVCPCSGSNNEVKSNCVPPLLGEIVP